MILIRGTGAGVQGEQARTSKIFRAQQRPDQIDEQKGGNDAAECEIEHSSDLSTKCNETDQKGENHRRKGDRDHVSHGSTSFLRLRTGCRGTALKSHSQSEAAALKRN
jgi:hypothetical protein